MSENNGLVDLFDDLMSGRKTVEQLKEELVCKPCRDNLVWRADAAKQSPERFGV